MFHRDDILSGKIHLNFASSLPYISFSSCLWLLYSSTRATLLRGKFSIEALVLPQKPFLDERGSFRWNAITRADEKLKFVDVLRIRREICTNKREISWSILVFEFLFFSSFYESVSRVDARKIIRTSRNWRVIVTSWRIEIHRKLFIIFPGHW